jgi:hypothetical protein
VEGLSQPRTSNFSARVIICLSGTPLNEEKEMREAAALMDEAFMSLLEALDQSSEH